MARAAAGAAAPQVMIALASFVGGIGSAEVAVRAGDAFAADDPIVRKYPQLFGPIVLRRTEPAIEQATAAPGEKRGA